MFTEGCTTNLDRSGAREILTAPSRLLIAAPGIRSAHADAAAGAGAAASATGRLKGVVRWWWVHRVHESAIVKSERVGSNF